MTERLLQYIWQLNYYHASTLVTTENNPIQVIYPGLLNTNQGPDFLNAKIRIGETTWVGSVEIHINSSEWNEHNHSNDANYNNVILHVVWKEDVKLNLPFATLVLQDRVSNVLLGRYEEMMLTTGFIPCEQHVARADEVVIQIWKERMLIERLQHRTTKVVELLENNGTNWEETFWWMIARNFGLKVNSDSFEKIARSVPVKVLAKHKNQIHQLEALLLGQAGTLDKQFAEAYPNMLRKEYAYLRKKYNLQKVHYPLYYLRMRPANFPTLRLAQLAALVHSSQHLFSNVIAASKVIELRQLLNVTANDYWHYHYLFDEITTFSKKNLGAQMIDNILINTCIPVVYAYGYFNNNEGYKSKAVEWSREIPPEKNAITKGFEKLGMSNKTAHDSQALLHLKKNYCDCRHCLNCGIGNAVLGAREW